MRYGILVFIVCSFSCKTSIKDPIAFNAWIHNEKNGLVQKQLTDEIEMKMTYLPSTLMAFNNLDEKEMNNSAFEKSLEGFKGTLYFQFQLSVKDNKKDILKYALQNENDYYERLEYLNNRISEDMKLITSSNDTLDCKISHFERTYNVSPKINILLGFASNKLNQDFQVLWKDEMFYFKDFLFQYKIKNINAVPNFNIN
jgi:hypothetical protein